jgi:hypothetical protein
VHTRTLQPQQHGLPPCAQHCTCACTMHQPTAAAAASYHLQRWH